MKIHLFTHMLTEHNPTNPYSPCTFSGTASLLRGLAAWGG